MSQSIFNHVGIHLNDIERGRQFYDAVLSTLGLRRYLDIEWAKASAYGVHTSRLFIVEPVATPITVSSSHIALTAHSRAEVDAFFAKGVELGGTAVEHPHTYDDDSGDGRALIAYTASFRDFQGNWIEAVYVAPRP